MKAIRVHGCGGPSMLTPEEIPDPNPGPGELLVRVRAAGVNPVDAYMHTGTYARKPAPKLKRINACLTRRFGGTDAGV
jgi:NADPH:quinone reductase